ncbi:swi5-like zinc finger protein [Coemansia sp. IMI 209127]|nr:swi5-like zinc finger protein [Coemansia sp. IMI 209127]
MDASPSKRSSKARSTEEETLQLADRTAGLGSNEKPADENGKPLFKDSLEAERFKELEEVVSSLRQELETLTQKKEASLSEKDMTLEKAHEMNEEHIDRLHRYNDIKDAGQILFGKLAELRGKVVKEMYEEYGVNLKD